jgi:hypothetical protein
MKLARSLEKRPGLISPDLQPRRRLTILRLAGGSHEAPLTQQQPRRTAQPGGPGPGAPNPHAVLPTDWTLSARLEAYDGQRPPLRPRSSIAGPPHLT